MAKKKKNGKGTNGSRGVQVFAGSSNTPAIFGSLSNNLVGPSMVPSIFPTRMRTKITWEDTVITTADASVATTTGTAIPYRLNDVFIPRLTGHQPYALDTVATLYRRYHVYNARIEGCCMSRNTPTTTVFAFMILRPSGATFSVGALASASSIVGEKPLARMFMLSGSSNRQAADFSFDVPIHLLEGLTRQEYDANDNYRALITASPNLVPTLQVANSSSTTLSAPCDWRVRIVFDVEFYERIILAQS